MKDLTIIIPSFNRPKSLKLQVRYWENTDATVIILDGSKAPLSFNNSLPNNISYYHLPISLSARLAYSQSLIKTKFVVMLGDDEIYLHSCLKACVEFLKKNPDYSSCKGLCVGFRRNYFTARLEGTFEYQNLRHYSLNSDNPCDRVTNHLSDYRCASIYAVHTKEVYEKLAKISGFGRKYSATASMEMQVSIVVAWMGKIKVLDQLMWFRNRENPSLHLNNTLVDPWIWIKDPKYANEIKQFINDFEKVFPNDPNIKNCTEEGLKLFSSRYLTLKKKTFIKLFKWFVTQCWIWLYEPIKSIIRPIIGTNESMIKVAISLNKIGVKIDHDELKSVTKFLETN